MCKEPRSWYKAGEFYTTPFGPDQEKWPPGFKGSLARKSLQTVKLKAYSFNFFQLFRLTRSILNEKPPSLLQLKAVNQSISEKRNYQNRFSTKQNYRDKLQTSLS
ncbi:hypothetical protein CNR22_10655 [Sphingobacteriaceae bacterium]|nr:hypothetical protein CNR22_10655 [Sphingobacteriaceae bacterium]